MSEDLDSATNLLNAALDRYNIICTRLRRESVPGVKPLIDNTPEHTHRVTEELSRVSSYETEIQYSKAALLQLRNFSESRPYMLPPEILVRIFEDVINMHPCPALENRFYTPAETAFLRDPVVLSHVCSRWRRVAINAATLWSHIDLNPTQVDDPRMSTRLDVYVARSVDSLLDFHITERSESPRGVSLPYLEIHPAIVDWLTLTAHRMRSLTIHGAQKNKEVYHAFLATCFSNCTPGTLIDVSIRFAGSDSPRVAIAAALGLQSEKDPFAGLPPEVVEAVWHPVIRLQFNSYCPKWTSRAYQGLIELRLVGGRSISHSQLTSILQSSPLLRVLELDLGLQEYTPNDSNTPIIPVHLDNLEILILGSTDQQLGQILQLIAPGSRPLSLSLVNPYLSTRVFAFKDELARFAAHSNITRVCTHEFDDYADLVEVLNLMPTVRVVAVNALRSRTIDGDSPPPNLSIETFYVLNSCSKFRQFTWPQIEQFVQRHQVHKLVLWQYDFRFCGLSEPGRVLIPDNLYDICPVVNVIPLTDPNPIMEWFGE